MRRTITLLAVGVVFATAAPIASGHGGQKPNKPVRESFIFTEWKGPKATLADTILAVDAVVRVRVLGSTVRDTKDLVTAYRLKVEEIIQAFGGRAVDASEITLLRDVGERDRGAYIERLIENPPFPPIELGHEYVLFLNWSPSRGAWEPAIGPDSVIDITKGIVEARGTAAITSAAKGQPAAEYLTLLRRFGRK
jgi:hypothetical protein